MHRRKRHTLSKRLHRLFYDVKAPGFYVVNDVLAVVTVVSVVTLILETVPSLEAYMSLFTVVEYAAVVLFSLEYIGRIIANRGQVKKYVFSFFGIIDLLAIVPTYFGLSSFAFLKTARVLRILRLLRMVRLAKLAQRPRKHMRDIEEGIGSYKLSIQIYFATLLSAVIFSGTMVYLIEGGDGFYSIPVGMLWALKVTMGSTPAIMPVTFLGEMITILTYFFGLLLFGLLISVMGNALNRLLLGGGVKT